MSQRLPIFIISFNRADFLRRVIESYRRQSWPVDIVVHDNGSDDPATLGVLAQLEAGGVPVRRHAKIACAADLDLVDLTIDAYFGAGARRSRYVVTDCDVDLSPARPDALAVYGDLLDRFGQAECVGPMLRIADIPESYALFNRVMNRHIEQFWHRRPDVIASRFGEVAFIPATIDTTFAIHRENSRFRRLKPGLRVYHPFEARHLDWYPDAAQLAYRRSSSPAISHWNNAAQFAEFADEALHFAEYTIVETGADGRLAVRQRPVRA